MFKHVGEVAGMKGVPIVHPPYTAPKVLPSSWLSDFISTPAPQLVPQRDSKSAPLGRAGSGIKWRWERCRIVYEGHIFSL